MKNIFKLFCGKDKGSIDIISDRYFKKKLDNINYFLGLRVANEIKQIIKNCERGY